MIVEGHFDDSHRLVCLHANSDPRDSVRSSNFRPLPMVLTAVDHILPMVTNRWCESNNSVVPSKRNARPTSYGLQCLSESGDAPWHSDRNFYTSFSA